MGKKKTFLIDNEKQLREIATPVRNEIRLAMEMLGRCSIAELAEHMRRSAESLYYHIRKLENAGLVVQVDTRIANGREEAVYSLCAPRMRVDTSNRQPKFIAALIRGARILLRFSERSLSRAFEDPNVRMQGDNRECRIIQLISRVDNKKLAELNRRILDLEEFMQSCDDPGSDQKFVLTVCLSPMTATAEDE